MEVDQYSNQVSQLASEQIEEFRQYQSAKNTLLRFFEKMKGAVAAGEAAAAKLNMPEGKKSGLL